MGHLSFTLVKLSQILCQQLLNCSADCSIVPQAEDAPDLMSVPPPPPIPQQQYYPPPGSMPMDFRAQQWMQAGWGGASTGPVPNQGPRMIPNQYYSRGRGNSQRPFYPQGQGRGGMRASLQNYNNYNNFNQVSTHLPYSSNNPFTALKVIRVFYPTIFPTLRRNKRGKLVTFFHILFN